MKRQLTFLFILFFWHLISQECDTVYSHVDVLPKFQNNSRDLLKYVELELVPIINECILNDSEIVSSLSILLTIQQDGQVVDASFPKDEYLSIQCKVLLKAKLLMMDGWTPGQINGQSVCCFHYFPIKCLKWNE